MSPGPQADLGPASPSISRLRRGHSREISHLYALEQIFDRSVELLQAEFAYVPGGDVAKATALWVAGEARVELVLREMDADWLAEIMVERGAEAERAPGMPERSPEPPRACTPTPELAPICVPELAAA